MNKNIEIIGHRGDFYNKVENTLESIYSCWQYVDGCEVDVQLTKDNEVVLYHDDFLGGAGFKKKNVTNKLISEYSYKELKKVKFDKSLLEKQLSAKAKKDIQLSLIKEPEISLLNKVIIPKDKKLYIELKCNDKKINYKKKLCEHISKWIDNNQYYNNSIVISFEKDALKYLHQINSKIILGLNIIEINKKNLRNEISLNNDKNIDYLLPPFSETNIELIDFCKRNNIKTIPWTQKENMDEEIIKSKEIFNLNPNGIITNQPQKLYDYLKVI